MHYKHYSLHRVSSHHKMQHTIKMANFMSTLLPHAIYAFKSIGNLALHQYILLLFICVVYM